MVLYDLLQIRITTINIKVNKQSSTFKTDLIYYSLKINVDTFQKTVKNLQNYRF